MTNKILIAITILVGLILVLLMYLKSKREKPDKSIAEGITFDRLVDIVKYEINDIVGEEVVLSTSEDAFDSMIRVKARLQNALKDCVYGIDAQKEIVKDIIKSILFKHLPTEDDIRTVLDFQGRFLEPRIKFEILMYFYKKEFKIEALSRMIDEFDLAKEQYLIEDKTAPSYAISVEDIDYVYAQKDFQLDYNSMLDIMTVLVYQRYKGFGIVDTLREMDINGFNCGTSGSIMTNLRKENNKTQWTAPRSVWLYFRGVYIHLRFLSFGTEEELQRVIQLMIRFNKPGPLTEKRGYLVNTMFDKSRILAIRPPASEYWAVFIRKFTLTNVTTEKLLIKQVDTELDWTSEYEASVREDPRVTDDLINELRSGITLRRLPDKVVDAIASGINIPGFVKNANIVLGLIKYLMMGQVTCGVTGRQGAGKTTLMGTMVRFMNPKFNIRVLELAFELYLREAFPERNILSVQETEFVGAAALQDALKKSDAAISMVGEVASDIIAARMLQFARIASLFTIFSHHANRAEDLVTGIRDSVVAAGNYSNQVVAERQVIDVIRIDIHLNYSDAGKRYIERITEVIKLDEGVEYPEYDENDSFNSLARIQREYYHRQTDRKTFITRDILKYDLDTDTYVACNWLSTDLTQYMLNCMSARDQEEFSQFILSNWKVGA